MTVRFTQMAHDKVGPLFFALNRQKQGIIVHVSGHPKTVKNCEN